jgi:hypothetical protein
MHHDHVLFSKSVLGVLFRNQSRAWYFGFQSSWLDLCCQRSKSLNGCLLVYRSAIGNAEDDDEDGYMMINRGRMRLQLETASGGGNPAVYYLAGYERAGNFDNPTLRIPVNCVERMKKRRIRSGDRSVEGILRN